MYSAFRLTFIFCTMVLSGATQVIHERLRNITAGENVTLQCRLAKEHDVVQITWQQEQGEQETNMATYSEAGGTTILSKFKRNVHMSQSGLMVSAITFHAVTLKDEGCYKCIFNVFPIGPIAGRTCLEVYALTQPKVTVRHVLDPGNAEEEVLEISCSATGRPAPKITWKVTKPLMMEPKQYVTQHLNQTVTVVSNFSYVFLKDVWDNTITCVVHHPSLNTEQEVTLPGIIPEIIHVQNEDLLPGTSATIAICILVAMFFLGLLLFLILYHWRRLHPDNEKQDLLCMVLPVCPGSTMGARYSYTQEQVVVEPFPKESLLNR
ncbi:OX-2 membrane glycoprotein-like [Zootoca vivipara]|uniref:OX-2 membrane glycoprotein-like n=1 Tax=Zootoca vivipara TaxID=8524 RepID=UPI001590AE4E|nr:OX-2 membrane glycoprotein-like [Zootoca vivipara]